MMLKDNKKYPSTGGWGFQAWAGGDPTRPSVTDPTKQCFECDQPKKNQDYVYSTYISRSHLVRFGEGQNRAGDH